MSDNTQLNPGVGGDIAAADDIDGIKFQRVKLTLGADGVNDGDLSAANPLPVAGSLSVDNFPAQSGLTLDNLGFAYKQAYQEIYAELVAEMRQAQEDEQVAAIVAAML